MAASGRGNGEIIVGINVTPLVDITLVLLIIFIVTAKIIVTPAVPIDLPRAAQSQEVQMVFSVIVPPSGPALVNGEAATEDDTLLRLSREAAARDADIRAVINADAAVPHGRVIRILDLLKRGGITRVAFGALPLEEVDR